MGSSPIHSATFKEFSMDTDMQTDRIRFQIKRIQDQKTALKLQQREVEKQTEEVMELLFKDSEE